MRLPDFAVPILSMFQPSFSTPTYHRCLVLWLGAILTTGRQTITNILRTVRTAVRLGLGGMWLVIAWSLPLWRTE
jgi:hypothetical protein